MKIVIGIVQDSESRVLITQRRADDTHGGYWEFPGGKIELDEVPEASLQRELEEELGILVLDAVKVGVVQHSYSDILMDFHIFVVRAYSGVAHCREHQMDLRWMAWDKLSEVLFPSANVKIIESFHNWQMANSM